jgi:hypothetical protein
MKKMTASDYRDEAAQHRTNAEDSFQRCDTDGFLSQWASGINAQVADRQADIADSDGMWKFERVTLHRTDGSPVTDAKLCHTRYGLKWRSDDDNVWLAYKPARESTLGKKGYKEVTVTEVAPAKAVTWAPAGARGLSGATSVQVITIRTDRPRSEHWYSIGRP